MSHPARRLRKASRWKYGPGWSEVVGRMLNLERQEEPMLQGQSPGKMVVARAVQIDEVTAQVENPARQSSQAGPGVETPPDPHEIARRVWELMRRDLAVDLERRKAGR